MNKIRNGAVLGLMAVVLLGGPYPAAGKNPAESIVLTEILSIGGLENDAICMWAGIVVDETGRIYISDMMEHTLKLFDPGGRLIRTVGRRGQGPGEFDCPLALARSGDLLYVLEQNRRGIQAFDRELNFVRMIPCRHALLRLRGAAPGLLAGFPITPRGEGRLLFMDEGGRTSRTLRFIEADAGMLMDQISFAFDSRGDLVVAFNHQDRIEKFSDAGKKLWSRYLRKGKSSSTTSLHGMDIPRDLYYRSVAVDSRDRIFILSGNLSSHPARDVFVLDKSGKPTAMFTLPDSSHLVYIDGRDFLYARADSGVTLKKYRMRWVDTDGGKAEDA